MLFFGGVQKYQLYVWKLIILNCTLCGLKHSATVNAAD